MSRFYIGARSCRNSEVLVGITTLSSVLLRDLVWWARRSESGLPICRVNPIQFVL